MKFEYFQKTEEKEYQLFASDPFHFVTLQFIHGKRFMELVIKIAEVYKTQLLCQW